VATPSDSLPAAPSIWRDYLELTKPRVVALVTFTALVGTLLASAGMPPLEPLVFGNLGIALAAACAAALNQVLDRRIDAQMARTRARPLPSGRLSERHALVFAASLGVSAMAILALLVNLLTAALTFLTLIGYAVIYTLWLKRATPQNIVIGGAAGAFPPMIGWAAVTGDVGLAPVLMFLIIFLWTPPHFWALGLLKADDYARAKVPMLPVVAGFDETRKQILIYTLILAPAGLSPWFAGFAGLVYGAVALVCGAVMLHLAWRVYRDRSGDVAVSSAKRLFAFSLLYVFALFAALLVDNLLARIGVGL